MKLVSRKRCFAYKCKLPAYIVTKNAALCSLHTKYFDSDDFRKHVHIVGVEL